MGFRGPLLVFLFSALTDVVFLSFRPALSNDINRTTTSHSGGGRRMQRYLQIYLCLAFHELMVVIQLGALLVVTLSTYWMTAGLYFIKVISLLKWVFLLFLARLFLTAFPTVYTIVLLPRRNPNSGARAWEDAGLITMEVFNFLFCIMYILAGVHALFYLTEKTLYPPYHAMFQESPASRGDNANTNNNSNANNATVSAPSTSYGGQAPPPPSAGQSYLTNSNNTSVSADRKGSLEVSFANNNNNNMNHFNLNQSGIFQKRSSLGKSMSMVAPGAAGSPFGKSAFYNDETLRMSVYYNNNNDTELEERYRAAKEEELLRSKFSRDNSEGPNTVGEHGGNAISQMSDTLHSHTSNRKRKSDSTLVLEQFTNAIVSATNADSTSKSAESSPVDRPTTAPSRPAAGKKEVTFNFAGVNGK